MVDRLPEHAVVDGDDDKPVLGGTPALDSTGTPNQAKMASVKPLRTASEASISSSAYSTDGSALSTPDLTGRSGDSTPRWKYRHPSNGTTDNIPLLDLLSPSNMTLELKHNNTYKWVKNYSAKFNNKRKQRMKKMTFREEDRQRLKQKFNERFDRAYKRIDRTTKASQTEKYFFAGSLYLIFLLGIIIGDYPEKFHLVYSAMFAVLMPIRFITYAKVGYGYFLADLCYYVNILLMVYIWVFPQSKMLYVVCCSFSWGTLSFAVITWRNKLVLHSIDKTTSTFIHVLPGTVMYVITHQLPHEFKKERFSGSLKLEQWEILNGIMYTSVAYFVWQLAYHYFITIKRADKIKHGSVTSFEYLRKTFANKPIGKFVNSLPDPLPVVAFTCLQYLYQLSTMSLCPILYKYKYAAAAFVSIIFYVAAYNGATYYVDYYGNRMQNEVKKLQKELIKMQAQMEAQAEEEEYNEAVDAVEQLDDPEVPAKEGAVSTAVSK